MSDARALYEGLVRSFPTADLTELKLRARKLWTDPSDLRTCIEATVEREYRSEVHRRSEKDKLEKERKLEEARRLEEEQRLRHPKASPVSDATLAMIERERQERLGILRDKREAAAKVHAAAVAECRIHMIKAVQLDLVAPNGKLLRLCTYAEAGQFAGWYKAIAMLGRPAQELIGKRMTEEDLDRLRTWAENEK